MGVKYRVIHERNAWRSVNNHVSVSNAIDGKDGAINLFLKRGRIASMWEKHGRPLAVFVWEDGATTGRAFRVNPRLPSELQATNIEVSQLEEYESRSGCSLSDLDRYFSEYTADTICLT